MFIKNDNEFECVNCHKKVEKLKYTSRDHCNFCLHSIHIDITPGDRLNDCKGLLIPVCAETNGKKEQLVYKCNKCGAKIKNVIAEDDNKEEIYRIVKEYANNGGK